MMEVGFIILFLGFSLTLILKPDTDKKLDDLEKDIINIDNSFQELHREVMEYRKNTLKMLG